VNVGEVVGGWVHVSLSVQHVSLYGQSESDEHGSD
jgi:hypothetical protein